MEPQIAKNDADRGIEEAVPIFGTWRRIYAAVILCALLVMGLVALFSSWKF